MGDGTVFSLPDRQRLRAFGALTSCESGAAILEFALALPILLALLAGAFEIGRALLIREMMIEAVRGGASYLARVPDPTCDEICTPGAARAVAMTLDQIVDNSGLPRAAVSVSPHWDAGSDSVAMQADLKLEANLLRMIGLGPFVTLQAVQREQRIVE